MRLLMRCVFVLFFLMVPAVQAAVVINGTESDVTPSDYTTWDSTVDVFVGNTANGTLTINGDGGSTIVNSQSCLIGGGSESDSSVEGTVTISSGDAEWIVGSEDLIAGVYGIGELNVSGGGTISNGNFSVAGRFAGSVGTINISGSGSTWTSTKHVYIGHEGTGYLNITNGGVASSSSGASIGSETGSSGTANISGGGSSWTTASDLLVGKDGAGLLNVSDSGQVASQSSVLIGYGQNTGTVDISGSGTKLTVTSDLVTGYEGTGVLHISGGGTVTNSGYGNIGRLVGSTGTVSVSDSGSAWTSSNTVNVGNEGTGNLNISNGGVVNSPNVNIGSAAGSSGTANLSGSGSEWTVSAMLLLGSYGTGELNISSGSTMTVASNAILARRAGASGTLNVSGSGSTFMSSGSLGVGYVGQGTLNITEGGSATSGHDLSIGYEADAEGLIEVDGTGSTFAVANSRPCNIGKSGTGTLNVSNGAVATINYAMIGRSSGSHGAVNVSGGGVVNSGGIALGRDVVDASGTISISGSGSVWNATSEVHIGRYGVGEVSILDGGKMNCSDRCFIGNIADSSGMVTVSGESSEWSINDELIVSNAGVGNLTITDGGLVSSTALSIGSNGLLNMNTGGMLALLGDWSGSIDAFYGEIAGNGNGLQWWNETLGDWETLYGNAPETAYSLDYLSSGDLTGYTVLTVGTKKIPGDANKDGRVDGSDVTILAANWQAGVGGVGGATWEMGDFNGDGAVDGSDVTILAGNWQYGVTATAASVPEPSTLLLLIATFVSLGAMQNRRK